LLGLVHIVGGVIDFSAHALFGEAVTDGTLEVFAVFEDDLDGGLEIPEVVEGVEDAEDIDAVVAGALHEGFHNIVRVVLISHQVLATQQHGEGGFLEVLFEGADALPGIFTEVTVHGVEGGPAPHFHGIIAHLVHQLGHMQQVFCPAPGGKEGLVAVAEAEVLDFDGMGRLGAVGLIAHGGHFEDAVLVHLICSFFI